MVKFNGSDYDSEKDDVRLSGQLDRVKSCIEDGKWRTLNEIHEMTGDPVASISAQLRHLRKPRFGGFVIDKRSRGDRKTGLFEYKMSVGKTNWTDKKCLSKDYKTPDKILLPVHKYFGGQIPLDPATFGDNPTNAAKFYTKEDNGLLQPWDVPWFVNPPYGDDLRFGFCPKIYESAMIDRREGIALLPCGARFSTPYWQKYILNHAMNAKCYIFRRVAFIRPDTGKVAKSNPYDSILYGYNVDIDRFTQCFEHLGTIEYDTRIHRSESLTELIDDKLKPKKAKIKKTKKTKAPTPVSIVDSMYDGFQ